MVTAPSPGTMRMRFALVDAKIPNSTVNTVATYTPYASTAYSLASLALNNGVGYFACRERRTFRVRASGQTCQVGPGLARLALPITLVPFISQSTTWPLLFCHRISDRPSWL